MKLVVVVMGQDCRENLLMSLPSVQCADHLVYVDGGSTDDSIQLAKDAGAEVIEQKYDQLDPCMNGKQRNFYLNYIKKYKGEWCLCIDADEVVQDLNKLKEDLGTLDRGKLYSVHMRHLIQDLGHEDATLKRHYVPNRLFVIGDDISYPEAEHVRLQGRPEECTDVTCIWHLAYAPLQHVRRRYKKNLAHSNIHDEKFLNKWYRAHLFGQYPRSAFHPAELPKEILAYYCIDPDELYFHNRGIEPKHSMMVKQWYDKLEPESVYALGCGRGPLLYYWSWLCEARGVEISEWAKEHSYCPDLIDVGCVTEVEYPKVELITAMDILEHLENDQLYRVLRKMSESGNKFLFSIPFLGDPNLHNDPTHKQFRAKGEWIELIEKYGIKVRDAPKDWMFHEQILIGEKQ